jgi:glyoxylase-like metal-dependent hydrolase (beta-lactamase superfamily II)
MIQYLASLDRLLLLDPPLRTIAPGHGSLIVEPAAALTGIVAHRLARERAVAEALHRAGRATVDELLPTVYAGVREELLPVARKSLWAHLRKLDAEGAVRGEDRADVDAAWVSTA